MDRRYYVKVRQNGRITSVAVIVAVGVNSDGRREVLGMDIGPSEAETFWTAFLRKLARRGLRGVKLVVSAFIATAFAQDDAEAARTQWRKVADQLRSKLPKLGIFPNEDAIVRLIGAILLEQNDEWAVQRARDMTLETITLETIAPLSDDPTVSLPAIAS